MVRILACLSLFFCVLLSSSCVAVRYQRLPAEVPPVHSAAFEKEMARVVKTPWVDGNAIQTLINGRAFFPAMLTAIRQARQTVTFETFMCVDSQPVADFTQAFCERAQAGVKVHVILDALGCVDYGKAHLERMKAAGVDLHFYSPFRPWNPVRYNHRTHRRVLVVDGVVGYVGGAGLAYAWDSDAENPLRWRDTQWQLRGPVVRQLQENFNDNWQELTGQRLTGPAYLPPLEKEGSLRAQMVLGSPEKQGETIGSSYRLAIRAARQSLIIAHAYFIPDRVITQELLAAVRRGVRVQLILSGKHTDMPIARAVAQPELKRLLAAGVEIQEFQPCNLHGKLVIVDDYLTIAGSGNLDQRSFFINDENNLHVLSAAFAREQQRMCDQDCARSKRLSAADLKRTWGRTLQGFFGRWIAYQL